MKFFEKLDRAISESGFTNKSLSEYLLEKYDFKISKESIAKYRNGTRTPSPEFIEIILEVLQIEAGALIGNNNITSVKQVPIIGTASCGGVNINFYQEESNTANYNGSFWSNSLYCVIADGESMSPDIDDGDEVIIDPNVEPQSGDIVHYMIDNESAIKVLVIDKEANILQFVPYNQSEVFKTRTIRLDDEDTLNRLKYHKVVSVNKLKYDNRIARLKMIGRA